jgi:hypothetical protein
MENSMVIPQKLKIEVFDDPAILLLGIYPKRNEISMWRRYNCAPMFMAPLVTIAKKWKEHCSSNDE